MKNVSTRRVQYSLADRKTLEVLPDALGLERSRNLAKGNVDGVKRDKDPEHVEEDEVHPEIHEVAGIEVDVSGEPLGAEGHEACEVVSAVSRRCLLLGRSHLRIALPSR